jgi:hypothetical protein
VRLIATPLLHIQKHSIRSGKERTIRHLDLRQRPAVDDFVFLDEAVLEEDERGEGIDLIPLQRYRAVHHAVDGQAVLSRIDLRDFAVLIGKVEPAWRDDTNLRVNRRE